MNYKCYSRNTYITKEKLLIDANIFAFYEIFLFIDVCEGEPRCTIVHMSPHFEEFSFLSILLSTHDQHWPLPQTSSL